MALPNTLILPCLLGFQPESWPVAKTPDGDLVVSMEGDGGIGN